MTVYSQLDDGKDYHAQVKKVLNVIKICVCYLLVNSKSRGKVNMLKSDHAMYQLVSRLVNLKCFKRNFKFSLFWATVMLFGTIWKNKSELASSN